MHSTHFIYGYMASDIWLRTILIVRKETRCRHIGYSYRLTARVLLYAPSHRQDNTYHSLCYTSRGALAGTRNSSMGPPVGMECVLFYFYCCFHSRFRDVFQDNWADLSLLFFQQGGSCATHRPHYQVSCLSVCLSVCLENNFYDMVDQTKLQNSLIRFIVQQWHYKCKLYP